MSIIQTIENKNIPLSFYHFITAFVFIKVTLDKMIKKPILVIFGKKKNFCIKKAKTIFFNML